MKTVIAIILTSMALVLFSGATWADTTTITGSEHAARGATVTNERGVNVWRPRTQDNLIINPDRAPVGFIFQKNQQHYQPKAQPNYGARSGR